MSKPDKPGELRNVHVEAISLVSKAANRKTFKIFKSAKGLEAPSERTLEPSSSRSSPVLTHSEERGFFEAIKAYFTKGELADKFNTQEKGRRLGVAVDALWSTLKYSRYGDAENPETDPKKIRAALEDFKKIAEDVLLGDDADVVKVFAEFQKSGRKISGARLAELKTAQTALARIIDETDLESEEEKGDANGVSKDELVQIVKSAVDEVVKPLGERLEKLEKDEVAKDATATDDATAKQDGEADVAEIVKAAISEVIAPLSERIEKMENTRGTSNRIPEDTDIKKDASVFSGAFSA